MNTVLVRCSVLMAVGLASLSVSGCGDESRPSARSALSGRSFRAVASDGIELPRGSTLQLSFDGLSVRMTGGCNTGTADYDIADGLLVVSGMGLTKLACDKPLMDLDAAMVKLLTSKPNIRLDGDVLQLAAGGVQLRLSDGLVEVEDRALEDTAWVVSTVFHLETEVTSFGGVQATVRFTGEAAEVFAGCNSGSVAYTADATTIEFGAIGLTRMACAQSAMELEFSVATVLQGSVTYRIEGDRLTLINGDSGLVLDAAAAA